MEFIIYRFCFFFFWSKKKEKNKIWYLCVTKVNISKHFELLKWKSFYILSMCKKNHCQWYCTGNLLEYKPPLFSYKNNESCLIAFWTLVFFRLLPCFAKFLLFGIPWLLATLCSLPSSLHYNVKSLGLALEIHDKLPLFLA